MQEFRDRVACPQRCALTRSRKLLISTSSPGPALCPHKYYLKSYPSTEIKVLVLSRASMFLIHVKFLPLFLACLAVWVRSGLAQGGIPLPYCPSSSLQGNSVCGIGRCCSRNSYCYDNPLGPDADPSTCVQYGYSHPAGTPCYYDYTCDPGLRCLFQGRCIDPNSFGRKSKMI